jgi:pimeloyl-ACP methyl ester carboxylesterase
MLTLSLIAMALIGQAPPASTATLSPPAGQSVELATQSGTLSGTLVVPRADGKVPVVLIIAGSGPTDRDGNSTALPGKNNAYKLLAEALAAEGVASLRYDKRAIGESRSAATGGEAKLRFEMYADDAAGWILQLRGDPRFSRIIVAGHSEGSLIGMMAADKAHADGFVSIAGVASRASDVLRNQLRPQIGAMPELWQASDSILVALEKGSLVDPLPPAIQGIPGLANLFRPSVQPYLISWFQYVPSTLLAALKVPVRILQGTTDIQVSVDEAQALKAAKPDAELTVIEGMNHVMKRAPADRAENIATYGNPNLPIVAEVPQAIVRLVRQVTGR